MIKTISNTEYNIVITKDRPDDVHVDVSVYKSVGTDNQDNLLYERINASHGLDITTDIIDAQRVFTGSIKWDGCSDLRFFPDEKGYSHFCGKSGAVSLGELLSVVYDEARVVLGNCVHDLDLYEN